MSRPTHDQEQATTLVITGTVNFEAVQFLIDSGAEKSVIAKSLVPPTLVFPTSINLTGVGGNPITVFGHVNMSLGIKRLRRCFSVDFIVTENTSILGADFLTKFGLILDMKKRLLKDPNTGVEATLTPGKCSDTGIRVTETNSSFHPIVAEFPKLSEAPNYFELPTKTAVCHEIKTEGLPIFCKPRQLPPEKFKIAKEEFEKMEQLGIVRPSKSPWASPLHMVKKSDGSWRPCGDFRRLNAITEPDRYSIPSMQTFHYALEGSKIFTKLDLVKAYYFIPVKDSDVAKTAITTPFGSYEFLRMPFGLRNAASTFQRFVNSLLSHLPFVFCYIDDILIFSQSEDEHAEHVRKVLNILNDAEVKINPKKCQFFESEVEFLGHCVTPRGIKPLEKRIEVLKNLTPPTDKNELQRYLGMFGFYQRCIPDFSNKVNHLRKLVHAQVFNWTEDCERAFSNLKTELAAATFLSFPMKDASLTITADASSHAIGACLHQVKNEQTSPLGFFSRKLSDTETRYSTFDRELLAIFCAVRKWKELLLGANVTVFTDHKPLVGAIKNPKTRDSQRQERQIALINEYCSDVIYIAGKENVVADTLSRQPEISYETKISSVQLEDQENELRPVDLIGMARAQTELHLENTIHKKFEIAPGIELECETSQTNPRPIVPEGLRFQIFQKFHCLAHSGIKASTRLIGSRYFWNTLKGDVKKWTSECMRCQAAKVTRHVKIPLNSLPVPSQRFTTVHMDIVGPLMTQENEPRYLLTMIDAYTRWFEAIPLLEISTSTICKVFLLNWVARFGPPLTLVTDRGTQFCSELMQKMNEELGIHHIRTTAYHPQSNGMIERCHRSLKESLRAHGGSWLKKLPTVLLGLRSRPDESGVSSFSAVFGEQPFLPRILIENKERNDLTNELEKLDSYYKIPRTRNRNEQIPSELAKCSHVWLRLDRVKRPLEAPYQGPFEVLNRNNLNFTIKVKNQSTVVSIERLKPAFIPDQSTIITKSTMSENEPSKKMIVIQHA